MNTATQLSSAYLTSHPREAASILQAFPAQEAALFLSEQNVQSIATVLEHSIPYISAGYLDAMETSLAAKVIVALGPEHAIPPLRHLNEPNRERILELLPQDSKNSYRTLLQWPAGTAGAAMNPFLLVLTDDMTISEAMKRTRRERKDANYFPYVVDSKQRLVGTLSIRKLMLASPRQTLNEIVDRNGPQIIGSTPIEYFIRNLDWKSFESIPVVDEEGILLGAIRRETLEKAASQSSTSNTTSSWADGLLGLGELYGKTAIDLVPLLAQSAFGSTKRDLTKGSNADS